MKGLKKANQSDSRSSIPMSKAVSVDETTSGDSNDQDNFLGLGLDLSMYQPFSPDLDSATTSTTWNTRVPFENYDDYETDVKVYEKLNATATKKKTKPRSRKKSSSKMDDESRKQNRTKDSSDSEDEILARPPRKLRRVICSSDEDDDEESKSSNIESRVYSASNIPHDLLKDCCVVLKELSKDVLEKAQRSPVKPIADQKTIDNRKPLIVDGVGNRETTKEELEQRLAELIKRKDETLRRIEVEKRKALAEEPSTFTVQNNRPTKLANCRIPKLSLSKRATDATSCSSEYVSPLNRGKEERSTTCSEKPSPSFENRRRSLSKSGQEKPISILTDDRPTPVATKSILKKVGSNDGETSNQVRKPKKIRFAEEKNEVKYFESTKSGREPSSPFVPEAGKGGRTFSDLSTAPPLTIEEQVVSAILKWNPCWLMEAKAMQEQNIVELPPIAGNWIAAKVQNSYSTVESYLDTYKVLLLHEIWENVFREYQSSRERLELNGRVVGASHVGDTFKDFQVAALVDMDNVQQFHENVMLTFRLVDKHASDQQGDLAFFGLITSTSWRSTRRIAEVTPELRKCAKLTEDNVKQFCQLDMTIRARSKTNLPMYEKGPMIMQLMCDISPMIRLVKTLANVGQRSVMQPLIMTPDIITKWSTPPSTKDLFVKSKASMRYDETQLAVISSCAATLRDDRPSVRLVSGRSGFGKSQTVVGLIEEIQRMKSSLNSDRVSGVILLMAPDGETIDDLSRKILALNQFYQSTIGAGQRFLKYLRLGEKTTMSEDVSRYCMGAFVENQMRHDATAAATATDDDRSKTIEKIAHLQGQLYSYTESQLSDEDATRQKDLQRQIDALQQQMKQRFGNRRHHRYSTEVRPLEKNTATGLRQYLKETEKHRRNFIEHADVIACALDKDGRDLDLVMEMHLKGRISILCVIVDNACRTSELETLIAANDPVKKIFLFGDEGQSPRAVLSRVANENGLTNSLFGRILANFDYALAPVSRLTTYHGVVE